MRAAAAARTAARRAACAATPRDLSRQRADAHHAALHGRAGAVHRPAARHPGARHGDERADDGVDDGHVLDAEGLRGAGDRHRQADLDRRLGLPARGDRRRRRDGDRARVRAARLGPRRAALRRAGLRQRRRDRRDRAARQAARASSRSPTSRAACTRRPVSTSRRCTRTSREHGSLEGYDAGRRADHERGAARADVRHPRARRARGSGDGRERRRTSAASSSPRARTGRRRSRATASSPSAASPSCPDILTNAGGVTVSYFEWVQDLGRLFWDRDEIRRRLADKLSDAFDRVWDVSQERGITLRDAALVAAIREVSARARSARDLPVTTPSSSATRWCRSRSRSRRRDRARGRRGAVARRGARRARRPTTAGSSASSRARRSCARSSRTAATPSATTLGEIAEEPNATIDVAMPLDEAFAFLEEHDYERVPVVEDGKLVGVLSRSVRAAAARRGRAAGRPLERLGRRSAVERTSATSVSSASRSPSRTSSSTSSPVVVELLVRVADRQLGLGHARAHRAEHLAELGRRPDAAERAGARADHGDGLVAERVRRERPRRPVERVLERARDRRVVLRRREEDRVRLANELAERLDRRPGPGTTSSSSS